jgi:hypothetical protein
MTPEQRANLVVKRLHQSFGTRASALMPTHVSQAMRAAIADALLEAMMECREVCTFIPDMDRIANLVNGTLERPF